MAPARLAKPEDDDPVTAEYDVFITPSAQEQIFLLQYPNRPRNRPYNSRMSGQPENMRIKPQSGHLELDVPLNTSLNFNKYQSLRWGDALATAKDLHNKSATFGPAAGFAGTRARGGVRREMKDAVDRENDVINDLAEFREAEDQGKVMKYQTLGGQIIRHGGVDEAGKPMYFIGAFKGSQLHLTKVDGTVQMRPQFHHLDAQDQRDRIAANRAAAAELDGRSGQADPRGLLQRHKNEMEAEKDRLEDRTKKLLQAAEAEEWVGLEYVDEDDPEAFGVFHDRMFVKDTDDVPRLKSEMGDDDYLDAISAPRRESPTRRRKRPPKRKEVAEEAEQDQDDGLEGG